MESLRSTITLVSDTITLVGGLGHNIPILFLFRCCCRLFEERDITLYCDLHGHSRKQNVFIYGCENRFDPLKRLRERVFPVMVSKNAPSKVRCKD